MDDKKLKLIYVHKTGYNYKNEGLYEFIFSNDENNIDVEAWCWDLSPACDNALPPSDDYVNLVINLKTSNFELFCLHEAVDRPYIHGLYTIHALAYEIESEYSNDDEIYSDEEIPILVFHYGMPLSRIKDILYTKKLILNKNEFVEATTIDF